MIASRLARSFLGFMLAAASLLPVAGRAAAAAEIVAPGSLPGVRVAVRERGMHRLTYEALAAAGAPVAGRDPARFALWHLDQPVAIEVTGADDGGFDPGDAIVFYGEPYAGRYMIDNIYRLTWSGSPGRRMTTGDGTPAAELPVATLIRQRARIERNRVYYSAYGDLSRDADHLFDNPLYANSLLPTVAVTYTLDLPNLAPAGDATLTVAAHGGRARSDRNPDQSLALRLNGVDLGQSAWDGSIAARLSRVIAAARLAPTGNTLALEAALTQLPGIDSYWISPDWVEVAYPAYARADRDCLLVEAVLAPSQSGSPRVFLPLTLGAALARAGVAGATEGYRLVAGRFSTLDIHAYDVTDPANPIALTGMTRGAGQGSNAAVFTARAGRAYALAAGGGFLAPVSLAYDAGSAWRSAGVEADYIAIVHRSLWDAIQPLLDHRAGEGLAVARIDVQDVYDEFTGGMVDPEAIRQLLAYAYRNWNGGGRRPRYALLVGDGHYDFRGELRPDAPNLVPPYLLNVDPYIGETAADNRFASVDGDADFIPDIALGRIPARAPAEVTAVVDKILAYETQAAGGDWQRRAIFAADPADDPAGNFHALSDVARQLVPAPYATQPLYLRAAGGPQTAAAMRTALREAFDGGALYAQWFGHAARASWSNASVWDVNDPAALSVNTAWPFVAHFSCWSGYFINALPSPALGNSDQSLAEAMLLAPRRGSLAEFAPTGKQEGPALGALSEALTRAIFVERIDRVGLAADAARRAYAEAHAGPLSVIDTYVLLGDPATRLKLP